MDVLILSRLQFAMAAMFHFLFVPLTLGLSVLVAAMEWKYVRRGDEQYLQMAKFWGKIFVVNFAIGVLTGITLEFQFGTNWSNFSSYVGDIFGSLLAIEATLAFFLESTFLAVWVFGWKRVSKKLHAWSITLVAVASTISAFWILAANAWMQNPVGYVIRNGRAELTDFWAVVTQKATFYAFVHTVSSSYVLAGFFVMGVSAYHLLKRREQDFFRRSFRIAATFALVFSLVVVIQGHFNGVAVAKRQPAKLAACEALWETQTSAPMPLLVIPDEKNNRNLIEWIKIPGLLSFLSYNSFSAEVKGLNDFPPEDRPPVMLNFLAFRIMVGLGFLFPLLAFLGWLWREKLEDKPKYLKIMLWAIPLPYVAVETGWMVAEVGRQPWIVYGLMRTTDAVSPIAASQVWTTLIGFTLLYAFLGVVNFLLIARLARRGPDVTEGKFSGKEVKA
jgi:cytochrome d ubiquinol oxidase subunit I